MNKREESFEKFMQPVFQKFKQKGIKFFCYFDKEENAHIQMEWEPGVTADYPQNGVCDLCGEPKTKPWGVIKFTEPYRIRAKNKDGKKGILNEPVRQICTRCFMKVVLALEDFLGK